MCVACKPSQAASRSLATTNRHPDTPTASGAHDDDNDIWMEAQSCSAFEALEAVLEYSVYCRNHCMHVHEHVQDVLQLRRVTPSTKPTCAEVQHESMMRMILRAQSGARIRA